MKKEINKLNISYNYYKVIKGIFENLVFYGYKHNFDNEIRIINSNSIDQSFPKEDCKLII